MSTIGRFPRERPDPRPVNNQRATVTRAMHPTMPTKRTEICMTGFFSLVVSIVESPEGKILSVER